MKYINRILLFAFVVLLSSCNVSKRITYFQDIRNTRAATGQEEQLAPEIRLRPEDKISIVVNTKVPELTALFNLPIITRTLGQTGDNVGGSSQGVSAYTIKADGTIDFPVLGMIEVAGMTRDEVSAFIKKELIDRNLVADAVVTVEFVNLRFSVMGEVGSPGIYSIGRDHVTLLEALSMAGDLQINGRRDNVLVLRPDSENNFTAYTVDLRSYESVHNSPAYYIHQNDYIYVEPNSKRANESTVNANTFQSVGFWMSLITFLGSLATTLSVLMLKNQ